MTIKTRRVNKDAVIVECWDEPHIDILLMSDEHHDNIHHQRAAYIRHLEKAKERNAFIISGGDFFDAMQGRDDRRRLSSELKSEYAGEDYTDRLVKGATKLLYPYRENILVMGQGNHEQSALKYLGTNLTARLGYRLNQDRETQTYVGGYDGVVAVRFFIGSARWDTFKIKFIHGKWGGEVTKGVLAANRLSVWNPDIDLIHLGHAHNFWYLPISQERYTNQLTPYYRLQHFVMTPGYKHRGEWERSKVFPPSPVGCCWVRLSPRRHPENTRKKYIHAEITPELSG